MEQLFAIAVFWLGLAAISAFIAYHLKISIALIEICAGAIAVALATHFGQFNMLAANSL
jgi:hypothetical protein